MSIIKNAFKKKQSPEEAFNERLKKYHVYGDELIFQGCVAPIVTPSERLNSLKGNMETLEMANKCHMDENELQLLLDTDYAEPSAYQLMSISNAFGVSVLWLLGYHTDRNRNSIMDEGLLIPLITQRNSIEADLYSRKEKGFLKNAARKMRMSRIDKAQTAVLAEATRLVAKEHFPLDDEDIYQMIGRPVFVEFKTGQTCWGLCAGEEILVASGTPLPVDRNGYEYEVYMCPNQVKYSDRFS